MPGENLTRIEAEERAAVASTHDYAVQLDLTRGDRIFGSTTTVRFGATPGAGTFIDAITDTVHSVVLNGAELDVADVYDGVRIRLDALQAENELTVVADALYTNTGEGLHRFVDPVDDEVYLYSQFEVPDSRRMYAVFEQPDLKAAFQFTVTAPARWQVVSNQPTPEPAVHGDTATWVFEPTPPISSYITALVAGPYAVWRDELTSSDGRTVPLGVFTRASLAEFAEPEHVFDTTKRGFVFFEELFGVPYPFAKYDQLFVPEFNAGAMENAATVTITDAYVFRSKVTAALRERRVVTILHELAHMWFGDLVTMQWWNDLWLNESFAEFTSTLAAAEATEWTEAWTTFTAMEKSWAYAQDQLPSTHPIVAPIRDLDDVRVNFDGITYAKGASVLKQLVAWVGREPFVTGVGAYFRKHAWANATLRDLLDELEATSGRDLTSWSAAWLETAGVNTLRPEIETDADGVITGFAVLQTAIDEYPTIRPHRLAIGVYERDGDALTRTERIELDVAGPRTDVPELVGRQRPALILVNDDDLAYAKVRLDPQSLDAAISGLRTITSPLARSIVWGAAWDATRDAETRPRDYVRLVLDNIGSESESTTIRTALAQAALAATQYVAPDARAEVVTTLGDGLVALARGAEAGSDEQFQFAKAAAGLARTPDQLAFVQGLFDGSAPLDGLGIDTDLRWDLLASLVAGGVAGETEIAAELADDTTSTGKQFAAQARAALPTAEGKAAAWASVVDDDSAPNLIVRWTGLGFRRAADPSLLEPYAQRYFDVAASIWASRSYAIADQVLEFMFPAPLANETLADAARAWLDANTAAPAALRRIVIEHLAAVDRALAAQARDARA